MKPMTVDQWREKLARMTAAELKAHIEAFDTQLGGIEAEKSERWPTSFLYHSINQQRRECKERLAILQAAENVHQLDLFDGETQ